MNAAPDVAPALLLLWQTAQSDTGGSRVSLKLLLGLYNGTRFPFELTELRCLDARHLAAALTVIRADADHSLYAEVHQVLNRLLGRRDTGPRLEVMACDWKFKGHCNKEGLAYVRQQIARLATPTTPTTEPV